MALKADLVRRAVKLDIYATAEQASAQTEETLKRQVEGVESGRLKVLTDPMEIAFHQRHPHHVVEGTVKAAPRPFTVGDKVIVPKGRKVGRKLLREDCQGVIHKAHTGDDGSEAGLRPLYQVRLTDPDGKPRSIWAYIEEIRRDGNAEAAADVANEIAQVRKNAHRF